MSRQERHDSQSNVSFGLDIGLGASECAARDRVRRKGPPQVSGPGTRTTLARRAQPRLSKVLTNPTLLRRRHSVTMRPEQ